MLGGIEGMHAQATGWQVTRRQATGWLAAALLVIGATPALADWQDGGGARWQDTLAKARAEGKVVVVGRPDMAKPFSEGFKRDTGINLEFLGGQGRDLESRVLREGRSGNVTLDIILSGAGDVERIKEGFMQPIKPELMLPDVTDGRNWAEGKLKWMDKAETYMFIGAEYIFGWPVFNSDQVKPGEITSWQDLLKPQYKGKIAAWDPRASGPGLAAASYLADVFGIDFVKKLYIGQNVTYARDARQLIDWTARGTYSIVLGSLPLEIERFRESGVKNLAVGDMSDGHGTLLGGSAVMWQMKNAPHPNAATVFVNWFASSRGQQIYSDVWQTPSRRTDVHNASIPDYVIPKDGVQYLDQYQEDWYVNVRPKVQDAIVKALDEK
ncbi:MAG TPA: extracellular solute-binding protein [Alphaproteobacteria bacterium]